MIPHLIGDTWTRADASSLPVFNPATGEVIEHVPLLGATEVDAAARAALAASAAWSRSPVMERARLMFRYRDLLDRHAEQLAAIITRHHGKTLDEARGEVRRGVEVVEFACGAPTLLQGRSLRQVADGVDQDMYRFPIGVAAGITPFNFPVMIPLWMFPLAVMAGNTFVLKPSERTPLGAVRLAELFLEAGFPQGVLNVVHGAKDAVDALLDHPAIDAISFVGSERTARYVYERAAKHGKRVQAAGGAKNHMVVMPDADLTAAVPAVLNSAFGNAGERCLAGSVAVAVGDTQNSFVAAVDDAARKLVVGPGDEPGVDIGPLIRAEHRDNVVAHIERGVSEGARLVTDGRDQRERPGFFLGPTVLDDVSPAMAAGRDEIFGPVLSISHARTLADAIAQANAMSYGNMAVIFTGSGAAAREFREQTQAGMIGVNVGVAQPFAFYPFSGWKGSFYGDLHLHGTDGVDFYTRKKMVISRWS
ncbi:MAG: methylmalonate-semialdehyde dehydrogenase (CoA acylating) [Candidatus Eremiobacter antarcticus]|nr:CoA-acylating methylmalonate-semialdehyde dehydrogenase [Candidatus Eremiobacteraeota bacterium]MBC5807101.1 CoA-acylating methylmalonate-semialdehyde dehydrogenase [Candidatus Eremiobacteraeota bacterium]PZR62406.1 MAG: methylmalonate-semialdehyde dehydrogenase (CoA acylating) [Candidatus Eremiobacter sp. RRmetagenome_bin22]